MPVIKNSRHEKFALAAFKGKSGKDAAIEAGYLYNNNDDRAIRVTASRLLTNPNIQARIKELHEEAAELAKSDAVMDVEERQERLTEIGREAIEGKYGPLRQPNISAIRELNLMGGDYAPSKVEVDPGEKLTPILQELLLRLRGYGKPEE